MVLSVFLVGSPASGPSLETVTFTCVLSPGLVGYLLRGPASVRASTGAVGVRGVAVEGAIKGAIKGAILVFSTYFL